MLTLHCTCGARCREINGRIECTRCHDGAGASAHRFTADDMRAMARRAFPTAFEAPRATMQASGLLGVQS